MATPISDLRSVQGPAAAPSVRRTELVSANPEDSILGEYIRPCPTLMRDDRCEAAVKLFTAHPDAECLVVCSGDGRPEGLVMRDRFFRRLSRRYGTDLYYRRPVEVMMDADPLTVERRLSAQTLLDQALRRDEKTLYDCVVVTDRQSFAGILTVADLLAMSAQLQKQAVLTQAGTVRGAERLLQDIDAAVSDVRASTAAGEALSERMVDLTLAGKKELDDVNSAFAGLADRAMEQERQIRELQRDADAIGKVLTVIRDLADRSNLLAVNAAIEAARAGEHGKGFGVVADEVRQMAAATKASAGEIAALIRAMLGSVERAAALAGAGREEAAASEPAVGRASRAFEELFHAAADNRGSAREIGRLAERAHERSSAVAGDMRRLLDELREDRTIVKKR